MSPAKHEAWSTGRNHGDSAQRYAVAYGTTETPRAEAQRRAREHWPSSDQVRLRSAYVVGFIAGWRDAEQDDDGRNHAHAITNLRLAAEGERSMPHPDWAYAHRMDAVAALLECHDATGINLATFGPVGDFVNDVLSDFGYAPFKDNGV